MHHMDSAVLSLLEVVAIKEVIMMVALIRETKWLGRRFDKITNALLFLSVGVLAYLLTLNLYNLCIHFIRSVAAPQDEDALNGLRYYADQTILLGFFIAIAKHIFGLERDLSFVYRWVNDYRELKVRESLEAELRELEADLAAEFEWMRAAAA